MKMKRDFTKLYPVFRLYGDMKIILDAMNQTTVLFIYQTFNIIKTNQTQKVIIMLSMLMKRIFNHFKKNFRILMCNNKPFVKSFPTKHKQLTFLL